MFHALMGQKKLQHPTRPVENVTLTTKGLQESKTTIGWHDGGNIGMEGG